MSARFVPCPGCQRHVRAVEARCPFCRGELTPSGADALPSPPSGLSRAELYWYGKRGVAVAMGASALVACGGNPQPLPPYGVPCDVDCSFEVPDASGDVGSDGGG